MIPRHAASANQTPPPNHPKEGPVEKLPRFLPVGQRVEERLDFAEDVVAEDVAVVAAEDFVVAAVKELAAANFAAAAEASAVDFAADFVLPYFSSFFSLQMR